MPTSDNKNPESPEVPVRCVSAQMQCNDSMHSLWAHNFCMWEENWIGTSSTYFNWCLHEYFGPILEKYPWVHKYQVLLRGCRWRRSTKACDSYDESFDFWRSQSKTKCRHVSNFTSQKDKCQDGTAWIHHYNAKVNKTENPSRHYTREPYILYCIYCITVGLRKNIRTALFEQELGIKVF
jgi:hypothetical protein